MNKNINRNSPITEDQALISFRHLSLQVVQGQLVEQPTQFTNMEKRTMGGWRNKFIKTHMLVFFKKLSTNAGYSQKLQIQTISIHISFNFISANTGTGTTKFSLKHPQFFNLQTEYHELVWTRVSLGKLLRERNIFFPRCLHGEAHSNRHLEHSKVIILLTYNLLMQDTWSLAPRYVITPGMQVKVVNSQEATYKPNK